MANSNGIDGLANAIAKALVQAMKSVTSKVKTEPAAVDLPVKINLQPAIYWDGKKVIDVPPEE